MSDSIAKISVLFLVARYLVRRHYYLKESVRKKNEARKENKSTH